jgi:hypothetical protein
MTLPIGWCEAQQPSCMAMDEAGGVLFVAPFDSQRSIQQFALSVTDTAAGADAADAADESAACSTVRLRVTPVRRLFVGHTLTAVAVLSPDTLLVSHHIIGSKLSLKAQVVAGEEAAERKEKAAVTLQPFWSHPKSVGSAFAFAVDAERRCVFAPEYVSGRITVHDMDSGTLIAEVVLSNSALAHAYGICIIDDSQQ